MLIHPYGVLARLIVTFTTHIAPLHIVSSKQVRNFYGRNNARRPRKAVYAARPVYTAPGRRQPNICDKIFAHTVPML